MRNICCWLINERLVPLFFLIVVWVLWAAQRKCVQNPGWSRILRESSSSEELSCWRNFWWAMQELAWAVSGHSSVLSLGHVWTWQQPHQLSEAGILFWEFLATQAWGKGCVQSSRALRQESGDVVWSSACSDGLIWMDKHCVFTQTFHVDL